MAVCCICLGPGGNAQHLCDSCKRSYDRYAFDDGSVLAAMKWAAERRGRAERKRVKLATRLRTAGLLR